WCRRASSIGQRSVSRDRSPTSPSHVCSFFFSSRRRHTRSKRDWSSDVCSSDLKEVAAKDGLEIEIKVFSDYIIPNTALDEGQLRSEERRVGKEWRSRWSRDH